MGRGTLIKLAAHNTSGVNGLRLRVRPNYSAVQTYWYDANGKLRTAEFATTGGGEQAVAWAMARREKETGVAYEIAPRAAWRRLKKSAALAGQS